MTKNDFIRELANMVACSTDEQQPKRGFHISSYWLTPHACFELAKLIEEVNNEDYGEGNWQIDKEVIEKLMEGTNQA